LSTARTSQFFDIEPRFLRRVAAFTLLAATSHVIAQSPNSTPAALATPSSPTLEARLESSSSSATTSLPDAPSARFSVSSSSAEDQSTDPQNSRPPQPGQPSTSIKSPEVEHHWYGLGNGDAVRAAHMASTTDKYVLPGQLAPKLTTGDKVELGLVHGVSPYAVLGWFVSSGYSHVINSSPNYGTDKGAYGERLGAAALRGFTEETFSDSVMAPIFHQDPRYYKLGPSHNVVVRSAYAVTRVLVTRSDEGKLAPNYSLVAGNLVASALTNAYYPEENRGLGQTAHTFGSAMGGAAFSYFASEFISGALEAAHLKAHHE